MSDPGTPLYGFVCASPGEESDGEEGQLSFPWKSRYLSSLEEIPESDPLNPRKDCFVEG